MNVAVIGPGALGCYFAARLCDSGAGTTLVDHNPERAERLARRGLIVDTDDATLSARPDVTTAVPAAQDLVIVLTKASATTSLRIPSGQPVLTIQNGLGNAEALAAIVGAEWVLAGSTSQACTLLGEGHVRHAAAGPVVFGAWKTCPAEGAAGLLRDSHFEVRITGEPAKTVWEKAIVSAGINPLTALLRVRNGVLVENEEARGLLHDIVVEAQTVAESEGFKFDHDLIVTTEGICRTTAQNVSSMLQDIRAGRTTEIEAITGEILRRGERSSLPLPCSRTVYRLIKGLESRSSPAPKPDE